MTEKEYETQIQALWNENKSVRERIHKLETAITEKGRYPI